MNAAWLDSFFCFGVLGSSSNVEKGLREEKQRKIILKVSESETVEINILI